MTENTQPTTTTQIPAAGSQTAGMTAVDPRGAYAQRQMQPPPVTYGAAPGITGTPVIPSQIAPPDMTPTTDKA